MKVLHVIPSLSQIHGGPTHALALMERALAAQGVTVETASTDDDGPHTRNGKPCGRPLQENGVTRRYFRKQFDWYKVSPGFARWIGREAGRYDLLHIHALFSFTSSAAAWAAHRAGVPYVVRPLGTLNGYGLSQRRPALKKLSMRFVEGPLLRRAAAIHFTSEEEAAEARQLGIPMKEVIVPLAVDSAPAAAASATGSPFAHLKPLDCALFLSRLDPKKNLEGLLAAVALLTSELPTLHLLVAGDGAPEYVASLKTLAASLGIEDRVTWAGYLEGDRKAAAFATASVFVLPSFSENFGIAAAEALAAGLPCVLSTGVAIAKEVTQAQAGIATGTDPHGISQAVRRIIIDKQGLAAMSVNSRRLASERFSLGAMGAGLKQLYTEILNR